MSKTDEICYIVKLTNATVIMLSETKLDNTVQVTIQLLEIEGYDLVKFDQSQSGGGVASLFKNSISYNWKPSYCINTDNIFID